MGHTPLKFVEPVYAPREAMNVARAKGRLRGKQPRLTPNQAKHLAPCLPSLNSPRRLTRWPATV
jgi:hypothetical protein